MAIPSPVNVGIDTNIDPETPHGSKVICQFHQPDGIIICLTGMELANPKPTIPSMKTLRARPHIPGASALQIPCIP